MKRGERKGNVKREEERNGDYGKGDEVWSPKKFRLGLPLPEMWLPPRDIVRCSWLGLDRHRSILHNCRSAANVGAVFWTIHCTVD